MSDYLSIFNLPLTSSYYTFKLYFGKAHLFQWFVMSSRKDPKSSSHLSSTMAYGPSLCPLNTICLYESPVSSNQEQLFAKIIFKTQIWGGHWTSKLHLLIHTKYTELHSKYNFYLLFEHVLYVRHC